MSFDLLFVALAFSWSLFYGLSSYRIFTYPHTDGVYKENPLKKFDVTKRARVHEGWAHFVCSLLGWMCLYILYSNLFKNGINNVDINSISVNHFLLLLIGLLGIVGFLPRALWSLTDITTNLLEMAKKIVGK